MPIQPALRPLATLACVLLATTVASAQQIARIDTALVREVMPEADRFADPAGDPPVIAAYRVAPGESDTLVGYVFLTSDLPPEQYGYSGPIEALVGMRLDGTLTGVRVTDYRESYMRQMGDFLRRRGFQEQFTGKYIGEPFRVWGDVDGISRVTISVRALSRGVRDAARRVAVAYGGAGAVELPVEPAQGVHDMEWFELRRLGVVERFEVTEPGEGTAGISLAYIGGDRAGEHFFGRVPYERALRSMERRGGADHLLMYAVDGSRLRLFVQEGWSIVQGADTIRIAPTDVVMLGMPTEGVVAAEATLTGVMLVKGELDIRRPFRVVYDLGDLGVHEVEYVTQDARILMAEEEAAAAAAADPEPPPAPRPEPGRESVVTPPAARPPTTTEPDRQPPAATESVPEPEPEEVSAEAPAPLAPSAAQLPGGLDFTLSADETLLERTLAGTSWSRVALLLLVLAVATEPVRQTPSGSHDERRERKLRRLKRLL